MKEPYWRQDLVKQVSDYKAYGDVASLQNISDLLDQHELQGRYVARSLNVDTNTFPLLLKIAGTQGGLDQSGIQGQAIMKIATSDYLKTASQSELDQFAQLLDQVEANSGADLASYTYEWIRVAKTKLAEIERERAAGNPDYQTVFVEEIDATVTVPESMTEDTSDATTTNGQKETIVKTTAPESQQENDDVKPELKDNNALWWPWVLVGLIILVGLVWLISRKRGQSN